MSVWLILETILLGPLKLLFEFIFQFAYNFLESPALAIIVLSLFMNILVLPLYKRADAMQEEAKDIENKLRKGVSHIKESFSGDEKMMILQTYYRQNKYKPTDALKGSVSLLLEIPFFMAAYQFLSNLASLNGAAFGPIKDLGAPDELLVIGGLAINVLPILMTLINVISSAIYLKGFPLKTKIQLYGMALFFLVFLYTSPSGLVFYWTLNNLFSLGKTLFYKIKKPSKSNEKAFFKEVSPNKKLFLAGSAFLTVLVGLLIPSTFIAASPQEFVDTSYFYHPLWYLFSSFCMAAGTFLVWLRVFYWLATPKGKMLFDRLVWVLSGVMLTNYMFFGTNLGIISSTLQYEKEMIFSQTERLLNIAVVFAIVILFYFIVCKWNKFATAILLSAVVALGAMSTINMIKINSSVNDISVNGMTDTVSFEMSTEGQNVVVLVLDRAMGEFVPYILNEKPELKEQFDGFTYYSNTISFGPKTNFGIPALSGGYEYTPVEMNKRDTEKLVTKHNESLKVMPVLFDENDYDVTVCNPSYANYQWIPDTSIYDEYPAIQTYLTKGVFLDDDQKAMEIQNNLRNFFCFGIMKTMPVIMQPRIYYFGTYNKAETIESSNYITQSIENVSVAKGYNKSFLDEYYALCNMSNMTDIVENKNNTFLFMFNEITHNPVLLQEPEYTPAYEIDNTQYDAEHADRFTVDDNSIKMETIRQMTHYQTNMAALLKIGEWLDFLRENEVYDNTRIIIVSDHGNANHHIDELTCDDGTDSLKNVEGYYPLLLVKDFNATGFTTSEEFMTNADVPTLATEGLIENPTNPFTGKEINNEEKTAHEQMVILSREWDVTINNGNTFLPARWASISDDLWDEDNWKFYEDEIVLKEHKLP